MNRFKTLATIGLGLLFSSLATGAVPAVVAAATPKTTQAPVSGSGQALEIAPPIITLTVNPGQVFRAQIQLRDISKSPLVVTNQINDFVANGEDGTPKILTDKEDTNNPFSLKDWVSPLTEFNLIPQQIKTLPVTISVPANASPGGHYGIIRFTGVPPDLKGQGVSLSASIGSLILLTVTGKLTHSLAVQEFSVNNGGAAGHVFQNPPLNFVVRIKNEGNIQEQPTGHIKVDDMFGKNIANFNINIPPHNILPRSTRAFTVILNNSVIGHRRLFGHYQAKLTVSYTSGKSLSSTVSFWVIPFRLIATVLIVLVGGFFGLRYLVKRYNSMIVTKSQGTPKKK